LLLGAVLLVAMMLLRVPVSADSIFDVPAFLLAMGWLLATPVTVAAAIVASRRSRWPLGRWLSWPVGVLWLASVVFLSVLH
jgi:FtsH-binding integral membrane protein